MIIKWRSMAIAAATQSIIAALFGLTASKAGAAEFNDFVFFGDSLTDSGNIFFALEGQTADPPFGSLIPPAPYDSRTFSDEQVWPQYLAEFYGLSGEPFLDPLTPGSNFAFGGATNQPLPEVPSPSLETQLGFWEGVTGGVADPDAVYFVQGGGNDIRIAADLESDLAANALIENAVNSIDNIVNTLAAAGANNIVVVNAPDIGLTPDAIATDQVDESTALSVAYNNALQQRLDFDTTEYNLIDVDLFDFITSLTQVPTEFNLPADTIVGTSCILPDSVCDNPDEYVFYDGLHPTSPVQFQFASLVNQQLASASEPIATTPEPSIIGGIVLVMLYSKQIRRSKN